MSWTRCFAPGGSSICWRSFGRALRAGIESYSIKRLEPLYEFTRDVPLENANRCLPLMAYGLESGRPETVGAEIRDVVEGYNRDDCISTLRLRDWLERVRAEVVSSGTDVPRRTLDDGSAPAAVDERARVVEALRARLLAGIPEARAERNAEQHGRWLLAYMLDYHRREDKALWFTFFERCDAVEDDLYDERDSIADCSSSNASDR